MNNSIELHPDEKWYNSGQLYPHPFSNGSMPLTTDFDIGDEGFILSVGRDIDYCNEGTARASLLKIKQVDSHKYYYEYNMPIEVDEKAIETGNKMLQYLKDKYADNDSYFDAIDFVQHFKPEHCDQYRAD